MIAPPPDPDSTPPAGRARPRVLLLAYACMPQRGSEPWVGWNRALLAAREFETWVICEGDRCQPAIEKHFAEQGPPPGLHFVYVPRGKFLETLMRTPGGFYRAYHLWQRKAYRVAKQLHAELKFDLVHQVTFCGYREPGYAWKLDVPFVWGPIGGTQNVPRRFLASFGPLAGALEGFRAVINRAQLRFHPRVKQALRAARVVLAANSTIERDLAAAHGLQAPRLLETGLDHCASQPRPPRDPDAPLRLLWVGELKERKGLQLLLAALGQLPPEVAYRLEVFGSGSCAAKFKRLAERLGIHQNIAWRGWVPRDEALASYQHADLFFFTSLRDTSGNVVLEALSEGVPVVCLDHQGAHDMVTETSGVKIPVTTPAAAIEGLRDAIAQLARDPARLEKLSQGAWRRAHDFLWSDNAAAMAEVYREVIASTPTSRSRVTAAPWTDALKDYSKIAAGRASSGLHRVLGRRGDATLGILVYHRLVDPVPGLPTPTMNVSPTRFRMQLEGLLRRGFEFLPLQEVLDRRAAGRALPPRTAVLTFDDVFESVATRGGPIMQDLQIPSTMFISTAYLDSNEPFPFDRWGRAHHAAAPAGAFRPLTIAQCRAMAATGLVELAPHTHTHQDFRGRPVEFQNDLQTSVDQIRELFGVTNPTFAFPFGRTALGYTDAALMAAARATGVRCALTTEAEPVDLASDPFGWPRINVYDWDDGETLTAKLAGWYRWAPRLQECFSRPRAPRRRASFQI